MKKMSIFFLYACLTLVFPLHVNADSHDQKELIEKYIGQALNEYQIPGASLTIVHNGKILLQKSWGIQSNGEPVTKDTLFTIGSVSKPLTSLAIMKLVEQRKIALDHDIDSYIPSFQYNHNGFEKNITIRHLLTHTSGISSYEGLKVADQNLRGENAIYDAVKKLNHVKLNHEPGLVHQYSPANYLLLGSIIENVTGEPFSKFMNDEIYTQLGMNRTVSTFKEASKLGYKPGYKSFFGKPIVSKVSYDDSGAPYGYTVSTADDMSKYIQYMLNKEKLLSSELFNQYISPQVHRKDKMYYGLGWRISTDENNPYFFHGGETPDSRTELFINPKKNYGFILLTNKNDFSEAMSTISMREGIKKIIESEQVPSIPKMNYKMQWIPLLLTFMLTLWGCWILYRLYKKKSFPYKVWSVVGYLLILSSIVLVPVMIYLFGTPWNSIYHYSTITAIFITCLVGVLAINGILILAMSYMKKTCVNNSDMNSKSKWNF
jgi:CubicO group peptidase (beta-lactamase class C family)